MRNRTIKRTHGKARHSVNTGYAGVTCRAWRAAPVLSVFPWSAQSAYVSTNMYLSQASAFGSPSMACAGRALVRERSQTFESR